MLSYACDAFAVVVSKLLIVWDVHVRVFLCFFFIFGWIFAPLLLCCWYKIHKVFVKSISMPPAAFFYHAYTAYTLAVSHSGVRITKSLLHQLFTSLFWRCFESSNKAKKSADMFCRFSLGDVSKAFCLQSVSQPLCYAIALNDLGEDTVHEYLGQEPSGGNFNQIKLDHNSESSLMCGWTLWRDWCRCDQQVVPGGGTLGFHCTDCVARNIARRGLT